VTLHGKERAIAYARELRRNQTEAEKILWAAVRNRRLMGKKFLRQHPIFTDPQNLDVFYIADFYCHEHRLVVELDGGIHKDHQEYDARRTEVLEVQNIKVIRFTNEQVEEDLNSVLTVITSHLH